MPGLFGVEGEQATEPLASADVADGRGRIAGGKGNDVAQALMVALGVVVLHELAHDGAQMALAKGVPRVEVLFLDTGHLALETNAPEIAAKIGAFLNA
jgi:hypothetical protein